jgi:hypothetical protein
MKGRHGGNAHRIAPHRIRTFKLSNDPNFAAGWVPAPFSRSYACYEPGDGLIALDARRVLLATQCAIALATSAERKFSRVLQECFGRSYLTVRGEA